MRSITKNLTLPVGEEPREFTLTKLDAFSGARLLKLLSRFTGLVNKAFGNLRYDMALSRYTQEYCVKSLEVSIEETEAIV